MFSKSADVTPKQASRLVLFPASSPNHLSAFSVLSVSLSSLFSFIIIQYSLVFLIVEISSKPPPIAHLRHTIPSFDNRSLLGPKLSPASSTAHYIPNDRFLLLKSLTTHYETHQIAVSTAARQFLIYSAPLPATNSTALSHTSISARSLLDIAHHVE